MQDRTRILFVCFGNICRSPIAEGIAQYIVNNEDLAIDIDSAGTSYRYEGEHPCQYSIHIASKKGIDISKLRSRPISKEDIKNFDYIVCMDEQNRQELISLGFKQVYKLGDYGGFKGKDVPDPYFFQSHEGLEEVFDMIDVAVKDFLAQHSHLLT